MASKMEKSRAELDFSLRDLIGMLNVEYWMPGQPSPQQIRHAKIELGRSS